MHKKIWSVAAALALGMSTGGATWAHAVDGNTQPSQAAPPAVAIVEPPGDSQQWGYEPGELTVPVGSKVTWRNDGAQGHDVAADDGSFKSPLLQKGQTFEHTFAAPGSFTYKCTPHPWMTGTVTVQ